MTTERHQAIISLALEGAQQSVRDAEQLRRALEGLLSIGQRAPLQGQSLISPALLEDTLGRGRKDVGFDKIGEAQARLSSAMVAQAEVLGKAKLGVGGDGGFKTQSALDKALLDAGSRVSSASRTLTRVLDEAAKAVRQQFVIPKARAGDAAYDAVRKTRAAIAEAGKTEAAAARAAATSAAEEAAARAAQARAANRQAVLDEKTLAASRRRQMKADALAAAEEAAAAARQAKIDANKLSREEIDKITARPPRQLGDTELVYSKRVAQADAASALTVAESKLARAVDAAARGEQDNAVLKERLRASTSARDSAQRALTLADQKLAVAVQNAAITQAQGTRTSFREDFITGFRGRRGDASYAEQFGQAAKFSILYGTAYKALFAITQTLQDSVQEGIEFQDSLTALSIASGRPKEELDRLSSELANASTRAGFAPSQGLEIGARSLGLYGAADSDASEQDRVARISAKVVSQLAVGSKKSPVELQGDIAAIGQALGLGAEGQYRIADLDAYFTKKFGVQQGSTLQAVGESATVGKAAGFSDEQLFAIAADMIGRTGQTSSAVSGFMAQIFSRGGEGSLTTVAQKYGIDPSQKLVEVLTQLAAVYQTAGPQQRNEIGAAFGRGKVQNAAIALLNDFDEIQSQVGKSRTEAGGSADKQFNEHMRNIGGQIAELGGDLKQFQQLLGASGILDTLGLVVVTFDQLLKGVNGFLEVWNQLPGAVRDVIIGLGLLALATKTQAGSSAVGAITGSLGRAGIERGTALAGLGLSGTADAALAGPATRGGLAGIKAAGMAAAASVGPWGLAVGGLLAIGSLKGSMDRLRTATDATGDELARGGLGADSSASAYRARADALESAADQNRAATGWFAKAVTFGRADDSAQRQAKMADAEAAIFRKVAADLEARDSGASPQASLFSDFSKSGIDSVLQNLVTGGASAKTQLDLLAEAIGGLGGEAETVNTKLNGNFAGQHISDIAATVDDVLKAGVSTDVSAFRNYGAYASRPVSANTGDLTRRFQFDPAKAAQRVQEYMQKAGITDASQLDEAAIQQIADEVAKGTEGAGAGIPGVDSADVGKKVRDKVQKAVADLLRAQIKREFGAVLGTRILDPQETQAAIEGILTLTKQSLDERPEADYSGRLREAKGGLRNILKARRHGSTSDLNSDQVDKDIAEARQLVVQAQLSQLEALRKVALRNTSSRSGALAASRGYIRQEIQAVVKGGGNADQLAGIIESAGKGAVVMARSAIAEAIAVAKASASVIQSIKITASTTAAAAEHSLQAAGQSKEAQAQIKRLRDLQASLSTSVAGTEDDEISGFGGGGSGGASSSQSSAAQIAAARRSAFATRNGGQIAAAKAAIASARADMAAATKGTVEYYNALGSLFSAQQQLAEAYRSYHHNLAMARIDATNPLKVAQLEAREAARQLRQDRRAGRGRDVLAQDRVDLQAAQANAEQTKFEQRLQAVQTADELGRISHTKYLAYLQHEHDRLERIKHRTYQQQQQLDDVDRLMQEASKAMQGQFNLGDIKLPTPYQVRRYIAAQNAPVSGQAPRMAASSTSVDARTVTIYIDGTASEKVRQIVREEAGKGARVTTTATRRRG